MARVTLTEPDKFHFKTQVQVRITDLNYGNHLGNDSLIAILHEARLRFLASYGCTELDLEGVSLIQGDIAVIYKCEGHYADILEIEITADSFSKKSFDIFYKVTNLTKEKTLALAKTGMVCFDYETHSTKDVPQQFINNFN